MAIRTGSATKLLDAAEELFFTRGIHATPVDAVLERAGVSAATLYRGYASKEALLAATLQRRHAEWLAVWDAEIARGATREARVLAVFDAVDVYRERPASSRWCAFLGSAAEYADLPAEVRDAVDADTAALRARLAGVIGEDGPAASMLVDELLLVVTGHLAMRLRDAAHTTASARRVAAVLLRDHEARGSGAAP